ncbi:hypothetical protein [Enterococcus casseliflavus]|uniref:hypothetical protein n=1 Tax=Enterococcus casseliflavus TaxID=37734 RepID=UPI00232D9388|nr:hypothetical protein [Enterococcus casseliflavus]MDB1689321.1 hypothetical protein [Enterococcus casseliflavus]
MKKFIDGKSIDEVEWYHYWFIQEGNEPFEVNMIVIDELLAISTNANKQIHDSFFPLLSQTALLGRSASVHLLT